MERPNIEAYWHKLKQGVGDTWRHVTDDLRERWDSARHSGHAAADDAKERSRRATREWTLGDVIETRPRHHAEWIWAEGLACFALGAGLMYYFDPDRGRRRRALLRDQMVHAAHELRCALGVTARDMRNRSRGLVAETRTSLRSLGGREPVLDSVLRERVRARLGHVMSHPGPLGVDVHDGTVIVSGPILASEVSRMLSAVHRVPGVREVIDRLDVHETPGDISGLQGQARMPSLRPASWSPATKLAVAAVGGALVAAAGASRLRDRWED